MFFQILILESCHKLPSYVSQALANLLFVYQPSFCTEGESQFYEEGWLVDGTQESVNK